MQREGKAAEAAEREGIIAMQERTYGYNMPLTLEKHFENLAQSYPAVRELQSLWLLLRKRIEEELTHSTGIFVNYSLHDGSHSRSIIQAVERFLGEERICRLSATDTFMLLVCIYSHDYGMSQTFNKIYDILGSREFKAFLVQKEKSGQWMEKEDEQAVHNLLGYLNEEKPNLPLREIYYSIMLVVQLYLRPTHWNGVADVKSDFEGLFQGHLKKRFIHGMEGIVEICMSHGRDIEDIFKLSYRADGMVGDEYHPRFVAAMLRLGDSLDLDNGRFPMWFVREVAQDRDIIPKLSVLHFRKHEAVSHLLITPETIEITAHCYSEQYREGHLMYRTDAGTEESEEEKHKRELWEEQARRESYEVAALVYEWTECLVEEQHEMALNWSEIAQPDFGHAPAKPIIHIYVDDNEYIAENKPFQMKMPQETAMKLLEGTSIYDDKYVGIREMVQNAVDASLLQLWSDLLHNRYSSYGLSKNQVRKGFDLWDVRQEKQASIFENYDITVEVIEDRQRKKVIVVVKDKGIGITREDVRCIADIGSSKEKNERIRELTKDMPAWLKPSGIFGIGLQSVFQLTDCIEFYTRQHNAPELHILLHSYGKNRGKIEIRQLAENIAEPYYDNAIPGTNVKIAIAPHILQARRGAEGDEDFKYYDPEFDTGDELHMLYVRVCQACTDKISESRYDYFNVNYNAVVIDENGKKLSEDRKCLRSSYICPKNFKKGFFGQHLQSFPKVPVEPYVFIEKMAYFWDKETCRCYLLTVRPCKIDEKDGKNLLSLPPKVENIYNISYKFNKISDIEVIYDRNNRSGRLYAGLLNMEVLILDDKPTNYMNIDRNRLRENAIDEEELLEARKEILTRWCEYFCEAEARKQSKTSGKTGENSIKRFENMEGTLISLILLFYRNVPAELFGEFVEYYREKVDSWKLVLEKDETPVTELWKPDNLFRTQLPLTALSGQKECLRQEELKQEETQQEEREALTLDIENMRRLPHRLVTIEDIVQEKDMLRYYLRLQVSQQEIRPVRMSKEACLYDYMYSFDFHPNNSTSIKFDTLPKKVYKPDSRFPNLLMPCFPRTYRRGRNMESDLDYCIKSYILSPIDRDSAILLGRGIDSRKDVWSDFKESVTKSEQMDKCVEYILKKRFAGCDDREKKEAQIRTEYEGFLEQFYRLLAENRDMVMNQFLENE